MENFIKWLKGNLVLLIMLCVMFIFTKKIITAIENNGGVISPGYTTTINSVEYLTNDRDIKFRLSDDKKSATISCVVNLKKLPKNGEVYALYRESRSVENEKTLDTINLEKYSEVRLDNVTALTFKGEFEVTTDKEYELLLLVRSDDGTVTERLDTLALDRMTEQIPTFKVEASIDGHNNGQYSYYIHVMNGHNNNEGNRFKSLNATVYYEDKEIFSVNLLENGEGEDSLDGITTYRNNGMQYLDKVYGSTFGEKMKVVIEGKTNNGEEFRDEFIGK